MSAPETPHQSAVPQILVIEDELYLRETLADYLGQQGYRVRTCESGEQGVLLHQEERSDVALIDLWLPGRDGLEITRLLLEQDASLRIVLMTCRPNLVSATDALREQVFDYLIKPFRLPEVRDVVERAVRHAGLCIPAPPQVEPFGPPGPDEYPASGGTLRQFPPLVWRFVF